MVLRKEGIVLDIKETGRDDLIKFVVDGKIPEVYSDKKKTTCIVIFVSVLIIILQFKIQMSFEMRIMGLFVLVLNFFLEWFTIKAKKYIYLSYAIAELSLSLIIAFSVYWFLIEYFDLQIAKLILAVLCIYAMLFLTAYSFKIKKWIKGMSGKPKCFSIHLSRNQVASLGGLAGTTGYMISSCKPSFYLNISVCSVCLIPMIIGIPLMVFEIVDGFCRYYLIKKYNLEDELDL